jgi:hypothetical protein
MPKTSTQKFIGQLTITRNCYEQILRWSLATTEINFICGGVKNKITMVIRIRNVSTAPVWYAEWNDRELRFAKRAIKSNKLKFIATGHSHAATASLPHPSKMDVHWCPVDSIELIAFPNKNCVRAWRMRATLERTLKSEIDLVF